MTRHRTSSLLLSGILALAAIACNDARTPATDPPITDQASEAAKDAGARVDAAAETLDVKIALMRDDMIDASDINVDTDHERKVVVLRGTVASEPERIRAENVAMHEAEGYRIDNHLTLRTR
jgi:osmotically-inducible protein OsmY